MRWLLKVSLCIFSACLLVLSFPNFSLEIFAWVGFVPLLFAIEDVSPKKAFLLAYICGIIFFSGTIYWLTYVTFVGYVLLVLYLALYFGAFGFLYNLYNIKHSAFSAKGEARQRRRISHSAFVIPSLWVSLEWLRSYFFSGFGWALLGYSQYLNQPVIQLADITGVWGVSFLAMMVNVAIYNTAKTLKPAKTQRIHQQKKFCAFADILRLSGVICCILIVLCYGYYSLQPTASSLQPTSLKISVIQGNIPQEQKWDRQYEEFILQRYENLSRQAAKDRPDLIIWPETALPGFLGREDWFDKRLAEFIKNDIKLPLLTGAPVSEDLDIFNSAVLISEDGRIIKRYDKLHLVPFGEYVPFGNLLPRIGRLDEIGDFSPGKDYTIFRIPRQRRGSPEAAHSAFRNPSNLSVLICFEDIFPDLARRFVKNGAEILVNITNDAWFGRTSAPYQHTQASVFRAIENRVPVVRAANTGLSCFIDQYGGIYKTVKDKKGGRLFIEGFTTADVLLSRRSSFYTKYGDIFVIICIIITIYGMMMKLWRR